MIRSTALSTLSMTGGVTCWFSYTTHLLERLGTFSLVVVPGPSNRRIIRSQSSGGDSDGGGPALARIGVGLEPTVDNGGGGPIPYAT